VVRRRCALEVVDKLNREIDLLIETFERLSEGALVSAPYRFRPLNGAAPIRSVLPQIRHRGRKGKADIKIKTARQTTSDASITELSFRGPAFAWRPRAARASKSVGIEFPPFAGGRHLTDSWLQADNRFRF
jgi:hypothetical protein